MSAHVRFKNISTAGELFLEIWKGHNILKVRCYKWSLSLFYVKDDLNSKEKQYEGNFNKRITLINKYIVS